jgi:RNA polymerase sigma-70 factor (ECF subfamily)
MAQSDPGTRTGTIETATSTGPANGALVLDWPAILLAHGPWLRRVVATRVQERQAVDEVMQEVALAVVAQRAPLLDPGRVLGWLYRLAVRQSLMYRRKAGRQRALIDRYGHAQTTAEVDPRPSPLGWLLHDERRSLIQQAMHRLPPRDADLLTLKYAEGWSVRELAGSLEVSTSAIEARLHRARGRLRLALADLAAEFAGAPEEPDHD